MNSLFDTIRQIGSEPVNVWLFLALWASVVAAKIALFEIVMRRSSRGADDKSRPTRFKSILATMTLVALMPVSVSPFLATRWLWDSEAGISKTRSYIGGAYAAPLEKILIVNRVGSFRLVSQDAKTTIEVEYRLVVPEKLVPSFNQLLAANDDSGDRLNNFLRWKLRPLIPAVASADVKEEMIEEIVSGLHAELTELGLDCQTAVTRKRLYGVEKK